MVLSACGGGTQNICTVELNSDSIFVTSGSNISPVVILQQYLPKAIIDNRAVGGLTTRDLIHGYETTYSGGPIPPRGKQQEFIKEYHPSQILVLETGGNDGFEGVSEQDYESYLRIFIAFAKEHQKIPIITGIVPLYPGNVFDAAATYRIQHN
jgi:hypothetical protein